MIVDQKESTYTAYVMILKDIRDEKLKEIRMQVVKENKVDIVSLEKFQQDIHKYIKVMIVKDEYPDSQVTAGIIELIKRSPGSPVGLI